MRLVFLFCVFDATVLHLARGIGGGVGPTENNPTPSVRFAVYNCSFICLYSKSVCAFSVCPLCACAKHCVIYGGCVVLRLQLFEIIHVQLASVFMHGTVVRVFQIFAHMRQVRKTRNILKIL